MPLILGTNSIKDTGFNVANSLRFNDGSSDHLNRTPSSSGNRKTWTWSSWVKKSTIGSGYQFLFSCTDASTSTGSIGTNYDGDNKIYFRDDLISLNLTPNAVHRDTSAWYHIVVALDTTQSTASNRAKMYINGTQVTSFSTETYPSQNTDGSINLVSGSYVHRIGSYSASGNFFDGYLAETVFIDGTALDPTSFGEFDEDSGIWKPIDVSGLTFGTNGFYLDFENSGSLGADVSGNGNNFTVNNLTAIDQTTDTPTNNFATLNPLDNFYASSTFSEGNLKMVTGGTPNTWNTSTFGVSKGKWYCEIKLTNDGSGGSSLFGIADRPTVSATEELGGLATTYAYLSSGQFRTNNTNTANSVSSADGDIIGIALDLDSTQNTISYYKNGTIIGSAQNITPPVSGNYFIASGDWLDGSSDVCTYEHNFGSPSYSESGGNSDGNGYGNFAASVPSGYFCLNTKNLAEYG